MRSPFPTILFLLASQTAALPLVQCELDKLASNDPGGSGAFGSAVALSGTRALVGATADAGALALGSGAVYVFDQTPTGLRQSARLVGDGVTAGDAFGHAVALAADTAIVTTGLAPKGSPGQAYVFELGAGGWSQTAQLFGSHFLGAFGSSASISGTTATVGGSGTILPLPFPGSVQVYEQSGGAWVNTATLRGAPPVSFTADEFGRSVSTTGDRILVGASHFGSGIYGFDGAGRAFVFDRDDNGTPGDPLDDTWPLSATLSASDGALGDLFGWSVSLSGDLAVIGAHDNKGAGASSGSAYVFELGLGGWTEVAKLTALDAAAGDQFGSSVALSGTTARVAAPNEAGAAFQSGSVYLFERTAAGWNQTAKHAASDGDAGDGFGGAVALEGDLALVGTPADDGGGSAYALSISETGCPLLLASPGELSLSSGGSQNFVLTAGPGHAGRIYQILGSASGISPGFAHNGFFIPLNIDAYFSVVLSASNTLPFTFFLGVLNAQGTAQAAFVAPAGLQPSLAGVSLHHAWVAFDLPTSTIAVASGAKQLVFAP